MAADDQPKTVESTLDASTRQRLEQIVESTALADYDKQKFFVQMGSEEKVRQYQERWQKEQQQGLIEHIEKVAAELRKRKPAISIIDLRSFHDNIDEEGITHPALELIYRETYKIAVADGFYGLALHLGTEHLHLPETQLQEVREKLLYEYMVDGRIIFNGESMDQYMLGLKESAERGLPSRQRQLAEKVYPKLLSEWSKMQDRFSYLFQAALLAQEYNLGREKVLEPLKMYLSFYDSRVEGEVPLPKGFEFESYKPPSYDFLEKMIDTFDLPPAIIHARMRELFSQNLLNNTISTRILARNILTPGEVVGVVNEYYSSCLEEGYFNAALGVREKFCEHIGQEKVSLEDLRLLTKIEVETMKG